MSINLKLTTQESLELEHTLDMLRLFTKPDFPMSPEQKLVSLAKLVTPSTLLVLSKIHLELGRRYEAQFIFAKSREMEATQEEMKER